MLSRGYYRLKPDTPGQLGNKTVPDTHIQFIFDDWFGDDLIACSSCFLITEKLLNKLESASLKGYIIRNAEIEFSPLYYDLNGNKNVPKFKWLYINGLPEDDFFIDEEGCLVVSSVAYEQIKAKGNIDNCEVEILINA